MKILIIGDQHHRSELPYSSLIEDGRVSEWKYAKEFMYEQSVGCDAVVLLGDNLNSRNNSSSVLNDFVEFLKGFNGVPIHCISGNHERSGNTTAIDFLGKLNIPNISIYTEPTNATIGDLKVSFLPYMTPGSLGVSTLEEATNKVVDSVNDGYALFHHHIMEGTKLAGADLSEMNEIVLPTAKLEKKFDLIIGGHIHKSDFLTDKSLITGSVITQEIGEHEKFIFMLDTRVGTPQAIKLPLRGIYKVIWEELPVNHKIPSNSIVKIYVQSRDTDIERVKQFSKLFDASMIIEQYPNDREKVNIEETSIDTNIESLICVYAKAKNIDEKDLLDGLNLIK